MHSWPVIFALISFLIVLTINSSFFSFEVSGVTRGKIWCMETDSSREKVQCCQSEFDSKGNFLNTWCTTCDNTQPPSNCSPRENANPVAPSREVMDVLQGGVFKNPQVVPELEQEEDSKTGGVFEQPESNNTLSENE